MTIKYEKTKAWRRAHPEKHRDSHRYFMREWLKSKSWAERAKQTKKELSLAFLTKLQQDTPNCRCCGCALDFSAKSRGGPKTSAMATLDRVNPYKGYVESNVSIICFTCNLRKGKLTLAEAQMVLSYIKKSS